MATPSNGFEVIFNQRLGNLDNPITAGPFFTNEHDFFEKRDESFIEIKEYLAVSITFRSNRTDAQFFLDGLETLPEPNLKTDSQVGEVYLSPSENPVILFDHNDEYCPLIPGFYRLMVIYDGTRYYSWVKVVPKQLEESQWELMKQEVEQELNGLAREVLLKKTDLDTRMDGIPLGLLEQFFVINKRFSSVMAALTDLYRKVNFRINKGYTFVSKERTRFIDDKTIRHAAFRPNNDQTFKAPVSEVTYDLPENRLVKKIIESISKTLTSFIEGVERTAGSLTDHHSASPVETFPQKDITLLELEKLSRLAGKMRGAIQWIKTAPWYESVGVYQESGIPHVMNSDPRYRAIYQLYRELHQEKSEVRTYPSYAYQWKRSDKLYEIWGYIQFIKALTGDELAFSPKSGWIFNEDFGTNVGFIPSLPSNTEVVMRKDNLEIVLVYEGRLPTQSRQVTAKQHLYTRGTHTTPDARLDVYKEDIYFGSIIVDFKYRPRKAIWDENLIFNQRQNEVMRQLVSYSDNIHSNFLFGPVGNPLISRFSPVQEVWAVYPNRFGASRSHEYADHKVCLVELTPGQMNDLLVDKIKVGIDSLLETSELMMATVLKDDSVKDLGWQLV
ncbi:DUF2357 domain-containing protein [Neobacillus rhizophilus]|uniref:DUF2357 domain-containing protein n=1 Tax=Neobacillus rhizophilus TaxID=2833579 RepID=A0A942U9Y7_9BACI|nr:DUF2357 domain-containing protein [Neobacillus rhizophilus]MBS4214923.1 DUF2357 domain-containing protein [Neobacillus rhizophilus]